MVAVVFAQKPFDSRAAGRDRVGVESDGLLRAVRAAKLHSLALSCRAHFVVSATATQSRAAQFKSNKSDKDTWVKSTAIEVAGPRNSW